jgi:hypothetical protein
MEYLKYIWIKIIAFFCCTQDPEISNEKNINSPESQEQKTELQNEKNNDENIPNSDARRMFNGILSTKAQGQLFLGIEQKNHILMQDAINHGANVNQTINGLDPLQYAIRHGNDYIIEFLLEKGAEIRPSHIELAQAYERIYETNLIQPDIQFHQGNSEQKIADEIRQYHMIANFLQQEMLHRERKKEEERNAQAGKNSQAKAMPKGAGTELKVQTARQPVTVPLSSRPRIVTFAKGTATSAAAAKSSAQNDDDDGGQ